MGFANRGWKPLPRTYAACQQLWEEKARSVARYGYVTLADNTLLRRGKDGEYFYVTFHGNRIVVYYPEVKVIDACGFENTPTTQDRIQRLTGVQMHSNARLGYAQNVRVDGWPYFPGMRIDNFGNVLKEDQRSDFRTVPKKAVTLRYTTLWKRLYKVLLGRWEVGEFKQENYTRSWNENRAQQALLECEDVFRCDATFIPHEVAMDLLFGGNNTLGKELADHLKHRKAQLRDWWFYRNDGFETIEVK